MTFEEFKSTLSGAQPPSGISELVKAIWYEGKNDWEMAHNIAQEIHSADGSWIHAYLHRKEGDQGNAAYWYRRAGRPVPRISLQEEWEQLAREFLSLHHDK